MVAQFVAALERPVSRVRLENYRALGTDLDMVVNYFYNLELSEALYPTLQAFEIALRNSIDLALTRHFGNEFWFDVPNLYPSSPSGKSPWQRKALRAARQKLTEEGKPHDPDRIVAEMHFGFWHGLLNRPFERNLWLPNRSALLGQVFPQTTRKQRVRQSIWDRIDQVRIIRNRVMHYEPIWNRSQLRNEHSKILEALSWISPEMSHTIAMCDRFLEVHDGWRADIEQRIQLEIQHRYHIA